MPADPVVNTAAVRSPLGRFLGELATLLAHVLGAHVICSAHERGSLSSDRVDVAVGIESISNAVQYNPTDHRTTRSDNEIVH